MVTLKSYYLIGSMLPLFNIIKINTLVPLRAKDEISEAISF